MPTVEPSAVRGNSDAVQARGSRIRVGDSERSSVATSLGVHCALGRLTLQECDERLALVYLSVYQDELAGVVGDLPELPDLPEAETGQRRPVTWRARSAVCAAVIGLVVGLGALAVSANNAEAPMSCAPPDAASFSCEERTAKSTGRP